MTIAIWLCNNKGIYNRDVKNEELLCSNLSLLLVTLLSEVILSYLGTKPNAASTVSVGQSRAAVGAMFIELKGNYCAGRNWIFNKPRRHHFVQFN